MIRELHELLKGLQDQAPDGKIGVQVTDKGLLFSLTWEEHPEEVSAFAEVPRDIPPAMEQGTLDAMMRSFAAAHDLRRIIKSVDGAQPVEGGSKPVRRGGRKKGSNKKRAPQITSFGYRAGKARDSVFVSYDNGKRKLYSVVRHGSEGEPADAMARRLAEENQVEYAGAV